VLCTERLKPKKKRRRRGVSVVVEGVFLGELLGAFVLLLRIILHVINVDVFIVHDVVLFAFVFALAVGQVAQNL
jgi:hypothetical protein